MYSCLSCISGADAVERTAIWAPCLMHRTALAVFGLMKVFGLLVPLFCATVLLHGAGVFDSLRRRCRSHIGDHLKTVFRKPPEYDKHVAYQQSLFDMLEYTGGQRSEQDSAARRKRRLVIESRLTLVLTLFPPHVVYTKLVRESTVASPLQFHRREDRSALAEALPSRPLLALCALVVFFNAGFQHYAPYAQIPAVCWLA